MTPIKVNKIENKVDIKVETKVSSAVKVKIFTYTDSTEINTWFDDMAGKIVILDIKQSSHAYSTGSKGNSCIVISIFYSLVDY